MLTFDRFKLIVKVIKICFCIMVIKKKFEFCIMDHDAKKQFASRSSSTEIIRYTPYKMNTEIKSICHRNLTRELSTKEYKEELKMQFTSTKLLDYDRGLEMCRLSPFLFAVTNVFAMFALSSQTETSALFH